jgi:hypothetical protein
LFLYENKLFQNKIYKLEDIKNKYIKTKIQSSQLFKKFLEYKKYTPEINNKTIK